MTSLKKILCGGALMVLIGRVPLIAQTAVPSASASPDLHSVPAPLHPATTEQLHEFYQIAGLQKLLQQLMKQMLDGMRLTSNNSVPPSVWDQMQSDFSSYDFEAVLIPAYQRYISQEDMAVTLAYMKSDAARRMKLNEPYIQQMVGEVSRKAGREIGEKAARDHRSEIVALQKSNDAAAAARANGRGSEQPSIVVPLPPVKSK